MDKHNTYVEIQTVQRQHLFRDLITNQNPLDSTISSAFTLRLVNAT